MKIKIFENDGFSIEYFEEEVNQFLAKIKDENIIDIKYQTDGADTSILIIYK